MLNVRYFGFDKLSKGSVFLVYHVPWGCSLAVDKPVFWTIFNELHPGKWDVSPVFCREPGSLFPQHLLILLGESRQQAGSSGPRLDAVLYTICF